MLDVLIGDMDRDELASRDKLFFVLKVLLPEVGLLLLRPVRERPLSAVPQLVLGLFRFEVAVLLGVDSFICVAVGNFVLPLNGDGNLYHNNPSLWLKSFTLS